MLGSSARLGLCIGLLAGCGGNVFVDGGSSGAGGATSTSGSTSTLATTTQTSASSAIMSTSVTASSTSVTASSTSVTVASTGTGGEPACETLGYVAVGEPCSVEGQSCTMHVCCGGLVVCKGGAWVASVPACTQPCRTCRNGLACEGDALCVLDDVHDVLEWSRCEPDPCAPAPLDCSCAADICSSVGLGCVQATAGQLTCTDFTQ